MQRKLLEGERASLYSASHCTECLGDSDKQTWQNVTQCSGTWHFDKCFGNKKVNAKLYLVGEKVASEVGLKDE